MKILMKMIPAMLLAVWAYAAPAQQITLNQTDGWGRLHQYHEVSTSATPADPVTMYLPQLSNYSGGMSLWFASEEDHSPAGDMGIGNTFQWNGTFVPGGVSTLQRKFCSGPLINRGGFYSQNCVLTGETLTLQISEVTRRVCNHSGRGQSCGVIWTLLAGVITR